MCRDGMNEELKYSIRSLYKNTPNPTVWVVGGKPDWYKGNHIRVSQQKTKHENVRDNLRALCQSEEISQNFILMNDDFFIVKPIESIGHMHSGNLRKKIALYKNWVPKSSYTKLLVNTHNELQMAGISDPLDYAIHVPMPMEREKLAQVIYPGLSVRTMYGNLFNVGGEQVQDVKVYDEGPLWANSYDYVNGDSPFVSSNDNSFRMLYLNLLKEMLTNKTECEK
jgi:hypothetical protein